MRILWVKANKILPMQSGGDIRSFNLLRELSKHEEVAFFSYYDGDPDPEYEMKLAKDLPGSMAVCTGKRQGRGLARGLDYVASLPRSEPYSVSRFLSGTVRERLKRCLSDQEPDVLVCDFLDAAINLPTQLTVPSVLFQHNVESEIWRRHAQTCRSLVRKRMYKREFKKMLGYEQTTIRRFSHVIAVSDHDRSLMCAWMEPSRISVVPTGVDLSQFLNTSNFPPTVPLVMFVGAMDWQPNVDAVEHFCQAVWPNVLAEVPGARFRIVGRNPDRRVQNLASDTVEVTGSVASVVAHLKEAAVVVVPLRIGGGTRLKIYEAMAAGKAIVSTRVGAEGLDVHPDRDIWLADEATAMTQAVVALLRDSNLRESFERAAVAQAMKWDWSRVAELFRKILRDTVSAGSGNSVAEWEMADFSQSCKE
jgi:glycosyltransferase involved in cell wall biosynthesis